MKRSGLVRFEEHLVNTGFFYYDCRSFLKPTQNVNAPLFSTNLLQDTLTEITSANTITSEAKRLHQEESLRVYGKFSFKSVRSQSLTIDSYREQVT